MPYCYYTCNLLPLELVVRAGYVPRWLGRHLPRPSTSRTEETLAVHPMTCPCVTKFATAAEAAMQKSRERTQEEGFSCDCLVVPGGCDAMRRLGDLLSATYPGQVHVLPLPRSSGPEAIRALGRDLDRLETWLRSRLAGSEGSVACKDHPGAQEAVQEAVGRHLVKNDEGHPAVDYPSPSRPGGAFIIAGPLTDDSLLRLVEHCGMSVAALESCTSPDRWRPLSETKLPDKYEALATFLLEIGLCPRRSTAERRAYLERRLVKVQASSVIYARQSFCDPGAYDALLAAELANKMRLPFLEIEVDFPFDASGPLRTRVEAFLEAQLLDEELLDGALFLDDTLDGPFDKIRNAETSVEEG